MFEGNKGFKESVSGPFAIDWTSEDLERVNRTIIKKYNAEIHAQPAIEGALDLKHQYNLTSDDIDRIEIETFDVAYHIIGGGEEGDKTLVVTKEQADHSLPYMVAAALCDGELMPAQYEPQRIAAKDVQELLRRVNVKPLAEFSARFPDQMPCRVAITLRSGRRVEIEKQDYEGFHTRPISWDTVLAKFRNLTASCAPPSAFDAIADAIWRLSDVRVSELTALLGKVSRT